jgi:UPF0716 protein FxsA
MPLLLVLLFIVVPIAELVVIIQVGQLIGIWWTVALLVADAVLGSVLARTQGRAAWRRLSLALGQGRMPAREVLDGALVLFGGALLLAPGFLTDLLGVALLLPPTRAAVRAVLVRRFAARMVTTVTDAATAHAYGQRPGGMDADVEGTAHDVGANGSPEGRRPLSGGPPAP